MNLRSHYNPKAPKVVSKYIYLGPFSFFQHKKNLLQTSLDQRKESFIRWWSFLWPWVRNCHHKRSKAERKTKQDTSK